MSEGFRLTELDKAVIAAIKAKGEPMSMREVADALGSEYGKIGRTLRILRGLGVLEREGTRWNLAPDYRPRKKRGGASLIALAEGA